MGNMGALKRGAIQQEDRLYGGGDPRHRGTHGILIFSELVGILRERSFIGILIVFDNPITKLTTILLVDWAFCFSKRKRKN